MLGDDYFRHDESLHALIGSRTGKMHRLGDMVTVKLVEAAPLAGALRFEFLGEGRPAKASMKARPRRQRQKAASRSGRRDATK